MHPFIEDWLARQIDSRFADLQGSAVRLRVPVRQGVLNEALARFVVPAQPRIRELDVRIAPDNRLDVVIHTNGVPLLSKVALAFAIAPELAVTPSPTVTLRLLREGGAARALGLILRVLPGLLPPEATWRDDAIQVDIGHLLAREGFGWAIPFITSGAFESETGVLWIDARLAID